MPNHRRAAVWKSGFSHKWVSEKGHRRSEFKVFAITHSPADPDSDSTHPTWESAMTNAWEYIRRGETP